MNEPMGGGPSAMPKMEDTSVIEGALATIEQAIADIRAESNKEGKEPAEAPTGPAGAMSTPSLPPPAGGKNSMASFLGA